MARKRFTRSPPRVRRRSGTRKARRKFRRGRIPRMARSLIITCRRIFPATFRWKSMMKREICSTVIQARHFPRTKVSCLSWRNIGSRIRSRFPNHQGCTGSCGTCASPIRPRSTCNLPITIRLRRSLARRRCRPIARDGRRGLDLSQPHHPNKKPTGSRGRPRPVPPSGGV